ncbi:MAG: protein kinase [Bradymonadaceae bacterium]
MGAYISEGDRVGETYRVVEALASGAYGMVYRARDLELGRAVVLKVLPPADEGTSETASARFRREMKIIEALDHPNIVDLYDFGRGEPGYLYMVLELVEGRTLEQALDAGGVMTLEEALSVTGQIADALEEAHAKGVVHRDLKPANVMLTPGVQTRGVKVLDFGMAKLADKLSGESVADLTREGMLVGTPRYIAPEQAEENGGIGPSTDLYTLGLLLYEMATGQRAVRKGGIREAVSVHVSREPLDLPRADRLPEQIRDLVESMVARDAEDRPSSAAEVARAARSWVGGGDLELGADALLEDRSSVDRSINGFVGADRDPNLGGAGAEPAHAETVAETRPAAGAPEPEADTDRDERDGDGGGGTIEQFPAASESVELELEEASRAEEERADRVESSESASPHDRFGPREERYEWSARDLAAVAAVIPAFVLLSARFYGTGAVVRAVAGLSPTLAAVGAAVWLNRTGRLGEALQLTLWFNVAWILGAHLLGPAALANGLWHDPVWFLAPVEAIPPFGVLADGIESLCRGYAAILTEVV